ncbi:hypothetical protein RO22_11245 [Halomonas sp. KHS3]|nr:hypothetical protein RO22_11245 [Halomonas sp. KHS3]
MTSGGTLETRARVVDESRYKNPDNDPRGPWLATDVTAPYERPALVYEWHGHLPPPGRCWRFAAARAKELEKEGRISIGPNGRPRLKRYLDEVRSQRVAEEEAVTRSSLELLLRRTMGAVAEHIARHPQSLRHVEWRDLERALREVFEGLGFDTILTRSGKDGGFDLRLEYGEFSRRQVFLVEVKHWLPSGQKPGEKVVSALVDVVARAGDDATGLILSSSGFTQEVMRGRAEVEQHSVRIAGQQKIVSLCQEYVRSSKGIWAPARELGDMILTDTW